MLMMVMVAHAGEGRMQLQPTPDQQARLRPLNALEKAQMCLLASSIAGLVSVLYIHFDGRSTFIWRIFVSFRNMMVFFSGLIYLDSILIMNNWVGQSPFTPKSSPSLASTPSNSTETRLHGTRSSTYDARIRSVSIICAALFSFVLVMMDVISLISRIKFAGTLKRYIAAEGMLMMTDASGRGSIGGGELGRRVSEVQGAVNRAQIVEGLASAIVFLDVLVVCLSVMTLLSQLVFIVLSWVYKATLFYYFKNLYLDWG
ncbi:hypothetical protein HDU97_010255 [Phlyctochytrium planicorne]|nr:hypothetical protein HDU97_010255 [Phlyctochytrium planicorne]